MANQDEQKDNLKGSEKDIHVGEQHIGSKQEIGPAPERREHSEYDRIVTDEIRQEIEKMELDDKSKDEAKKKAEKIEFLGEKEKIEHLLDIAKHKGVVFAIQVAKKTNDPYILDILHDILSREGFYKGFSK